MISDVQESDDDDGEEPEKEENEVLHALETVETSVALEKSLAEEIADLEKQHAPVLVPDVSEPADEQDETCTEPSPKAIKIDRCVKTLRDVLSLSGFDTFQPKDKDSEMDLLKRVAKMSPFLRSFASLVRIEEGILNKTAVTGAFNKLNSQQIYEAELAKARADYHCSSTRQSRFALWCDFSSRVFEAYKQEAVPAGGSSCSENLAVKEISTLRPASFYSEEGTRACQVLVVRVCDAGGELGPIRLCTLTAVGCYFALFRYIL